MSSVEQAKQRLAGRPVTPEAMQASYDDLAGAWRADEAAAMDAFPDTGWRLCAAFVGSMVTNQAASIRWRVEPLWRRVGHLLQVGALATRLDDIPVGATVPNAYQYLGASDDFDFGYGYLSHVISFTAVNQTPTGTSNYSTTIQLRLSQPQWTPGQWPGDTVAWAGITSVNAALNPDPTGTTWAAVSALLRATDRPWPTTLPGVPWNGTFA